MLLQRLVEYNSRAPAEFDEEAEAPDEFKFTAIPWIVQLTREGGSPHFIRTSGGSAKNDPGKRFCVPQLRRSGTKIKPQLLADKAEIALGIVEVEAPERAKARHAEFVALVEACAQATGDPYVQAVARFLKDLATFHLDVPPDLKPGEFVTFQVGDVRPVDLETVRTFWAHVAPRLGEKGLPQLTSELVLSWTSADAESEIGQCLICSEEKPIARVHPVPIRLPRSVSDQQMTIVSANKEAFWSYGLEQSFLAPTCRTCAAAYARAINRLVRKEDSHFTIGDTVSIFWTREDIAFDIYSYMSDPKPEHVKELKEDVFKGRLPLEFEHQAFYAATLSASGGRIVVRDYIDTTVANVCEQLAHWFQGQEIVDPERDVPQPLGLYALAFATVREPKDLPTPTPRILLRTAWLGTPLPMDLLYQTVRRCRAEQAVTKPRAALIKLVLASHDKIKEDEMIKLDENYPDAAYHCGRLLAVLGDIQRNAVGTSSVVNRFYGTMSTAPSLVLSTVVGNAIKGHLPKLERDKPGLHSILQEQLQSILAHIHPSELSRTLNPERQSLFVLGYYHQRAEGIAQVKARMGRRRGGEVSENKGEESSTNDTENVNEGSLTNE